MDATRIIHEGTHTDNASIDQVYESMVQAECPPEVLSWFDEFKVDVLYAMRTLSAQQRKVCTTCERKH